MKRFDAAIIGAGPDGLIAAITLARAGFETVVLDKNDEPGGRAATMEFHPGFHASLFTDELPEIPASTLRDLALARHGALFLPREASLLVSAAGEHLLYTDPAREAPGAAATRDVRAGLAADIAMARSAIARAATDPSTRRPVWLAPWRTREARKLWPSGVWSDAALADWLGQCGADEALALHLAADAVSGRAVSPFLAGSALHLLAPGSGRSGAVAGGMGTLGTALAAAARAAGIYLRPRAEVTDIRIAQGRAVKLALAGGEEVEARFFLSTLDVKRTFLGLASWNELPRDMLKRIGQYRMAGASARVLFALDGLAEGRLAMPGLGPVHIVNTMADLSRAHDLWRAGALAETLPVSLRFPSIADPRLAPVGKTVMTATLSAVPARLFDGAWSEAKRARLKDIALAAAERIWSGVSARVLAARIVIAEDAEAMLGVTAGDLDGGEVAPDQILGLRPLSGWQDGRTPIAGLYLGGPSSAPSPFFYGLGGACAARTLIADAGEKAGGS